MYERRKIDSDGITDVWEYRCSPDETAEAGPSSREDTQWAPCERPCPGKDGIERMNRDRTVGYGPAR